MRMNRRNVLVGLGGIVAGGGALLGTGAFSTVEAERTVEVSTVGDSDALLQFDDTGSAFVNLDGGDESDLLKIDQDSLNKDAITRADEAIEVTNAGNSNVGFYVSGLDDGLDIEESGGSSIEGEGNSVNLPADSSVTLDLVFDLQGDTTADDIPDSVTFIAEESQYSGQ